MPDERTADDQVMAAIELDAGTEFDPDGVRPRSSPPSPTSARSGHRATCGSRRFPVGATNKIDKRPLRAERWSTDDPVYWRPGAELAYRRLTADDVAALEARFHEFGRADAITRP